MSLHEIEIEYGERYTDFVMGMYVDTSLADDIDMLGWNMCGCDDEVFQENIGNCRIVSVNNRNGNAEMVLEFPGQNEELKVKIVDEFTDCWEDLLIHYKVGLLSRV